MNLKLLTEKIQSLVKTIDKEVFDVALIKENGETILLVTLDSFNEEQFITIDDCVAASRLISPLLDVEDPFNFPYSLQVSSPGSFRELKTDHDLARFTNSQIKIRFIESLKKPSLIGNLQDYTTDTIIIEKDDTQINVNRAEIRKIALHPNF